MFMVTEEPLVVNVDDPYQNGREHTPQIVTRANALTATQRDWLERANTFYVATATGSARVDTSRCGGPFGVLRVGDGKHLAWPEHDDKATFRALENLEVDSRCVILLVDRENGATLQLSGHACIDSNPSYFPEASRSVAFTIERIVETQIA